MRLFSKNFSHSRLAVALRNDTVNQDKKKKRIRLIRNIAVLLLSLVLVVFGSGLVYADMLLSQIGYTELSSLAPPSSSSSRVKISQALRKAMGVLFSPIPITVSPDSRILLASLVKSLSLETIQNPLTSFAYRISIASIIIAESVAFFPVV